ncbi:Mov34-domain-containing protein [Coniophora puteana RWD-64-598 SS2]|uniref:COP9 signalosome complex subunit 5 n=1 Tax=Coniophora puteana (strain RWD-64-598) TaxID=741705 RepID=A0A5M3MEZ5_CONPW|nr:Mov34-domain-containing protein [Coniophora puteana RWD-64-598 SS2]EIW77364.1 Mov34-domain-containing protein [Coniophora puteana RWD-64-598 SS2]
MASSSKPPPGATGTGSSASTSTTTNKNASSSGGSSISTSSMNALKTFSLANDVFEVHPQDEILRYDAAAHRTLVNSEPWKKDPHYFKSCKISAIALIKMVIHARSGVPLEVMGIMQGKVQGDALVVHDAFALPVQGTETRVNAANEANEYMVTYVSESEKVKRLENAVGWYHSHPGYGCWLSGIDVNTQMTNQNFQDPFVAVVIDPNRTISAGKVDIGAFRTFPENYTPPSSTSTGGAGGGGDGYQSIPLAKIEDFGVHANQYYSLDVEVFKSALDEELLGLLWNKYWVNTLSQSPLISNRAYAVSQLADLHQKLAKAQGAVASTRAPVPSTKEIRDKEREALRDGTGTGAGSSRDKEKEASGAAGKEKEKESTGGKKDGKKEENQLAKAVKDSTKIAAEAQHGLIAQVIKDIVFSRRPGSGPEAGEALDTMVIG